MNFYFLKNFGFEVNSFPKESKSGWEHSLTINGAEYDVYKLIHLTSEVPSTEIKLSGSEEKLFEGVWWSDNNKNKFLPKDLLSEFNKAGSWKTILAAHPEWKDHIKKVQEADYSHPILIHNNYVLDGIHRLIKAITEKANYISAKILDHLPEEAKIK